MLWSSWFYSERVSQNQNEPLTIWKLILSCNVSNAKVFYLLAEGLTEERNIIKNKGFSMSNMVRF